MKFYTFEHENQMKIGIEKNNMLADVSDIFGDNLLIVILNYDTFLNELNKVNLEYNIELKDVKILAPYLYPSKIMCIGQNYYDHCREQNAPIPEKPIVFSKFPSAILNPFDNIVLPKETLQPDFEAELLIIIGKEGKRIKKEKAFDYIFGYSIMNDVSARDLQYSEKQWVRAKSLDTFAPFGPCVVTKDEINDPQNLKIKTILNNEIMQDSNTKEMIFKIPELIEFVSRNVTLLPGDMLSTGTPNGVGYFRKPPVYLKNGDTLSMEIENIGVLVNRIIDGE